MNDLDFSASTSFIKFMITEYRADRGTAIGNRFMQIVQVLVGETTHNLVTTETEQPLPEIGDAELADLENQEMTLEAAQEIVYFPIAKPGYLPPNTEFQKLSLTRLHSDIYLIVMTYQVGDKKLTFVQKTLMGDNSDSYLYDTEDANVTKININGTSGYKLALKNNTLTLIWRNRGLMFELTGNLPENELYKIAASVK